MQRNETNISYYEANIFLMLYCSIHLSQEYRNCFVHENSLIFSKDKGKIYILSKSFHHSASLIWDKLWAECFLPECSPMVFVISAMRHQETRISRSRCWNMYVNNRILHTGDRHPSPLSKGTSASGRNLTIVLQTLILVSFFSVTQPVDCCSLLLFGLSGSPITEDKTKAM